MCMIDVAGATFLNSQSKFEGKKYLFALFLTLCVFTAAKKGIGQQQR